MYYFNKQINVETIIYNFNKINSMKITFSTLLFIAISAVSFSQKTNDYEKITYTVPEDITTNEYSISTKNVVSTKEYCKLAITITNKTDDILMFMPKQGTFKFEFGDRKPDAKNFYIMPHNSKTKTLTVKGGDKFLQEKFSAKFGLLIHISTKEEVVPTPNYTIPATKNSFKTGDFNVVLKKYTASTKEAKAVFECTYNGPTIAVVNPIHLAVSATNKDGVVVIYANDNKKNKPTPLINGEKVKISAVFHIPGRIVDMQFATMEILWNDTFIITKPITYHIPQVKFEINKSLSE